MNEPITPEQMQKFWDKADKGIVNKKVFQDFLNSLSTVCERCTFSKPECCEDCPESGIDDQT